MRPDVSNRSLLIGLLALGAASVGLRAAAGPADDTARFDTRRPQVRVCDPDRGLVAAKCERQRAVGGRVLTSSASSSSGRRAIACGQ